MQGTESSGVQEITFLSMRGDFFCCGTGNSCLYRDFNTSFPGRSSNKYGHLSCSLGHFLTVLLDVPTKVVKKSEIKRNI